LYTIYITPNADADLLAAIEYYNLQAEDLGYRFAELIEYYFEQIVLTPLLQRSDILMFVVSP